MYKGKSYLAIIPARGGSKRLLRKNVLNMAGKPLVAWTIDAAKACPYLDEIMVSTDDLEIADVATDLNVSVPYLRPSHLADDTSKTFDLIKHTVEFYQNELGRKFDFVVLLQPTSPLRCSSDISAAIELLDSKSAQAIISVCQVEHSPLWMNLLPDDLAMSNFLKEEIKELRSQELSIYYRLNGAVYICQTSELLLQKTFFLSSNVYAYVMTRKSSIDIDDIDDFHLAEYFLSRRS